MTIRLLSFAIVSVAAVSSARSGAQGQQTPALKSGVEAIQIETTVVDSAGRPLSDLTARDFVRRHSSLSETQGLGMKSCS